MADSYIIAENGEFPPQYFVMKKGDDGIYQIVLIVYQHTFRL